MIAKKVYVPNRAPLDYSDAARFGEVVFCTEGSMDKFDVSQMYRELEEAMVDSSAHDYILVSSLTSLCCVACSLQVVKFGQLHLLLFKNDRYLERSLDLRHLTPA